MDIYETGMNQMGFVFDLPTSVQATFDVRFIIDFIEHHPL